MRADLRFIAGFSVLLLAGCTPEPAPEAWQCETPGDATAAADLTLTAKDAIVEPMAGSSFLAWTYEGDVPGPVLRVPLGEKRRIKLVNRSPRPESLHFHGVEYAVGDDGSTESGGMVNPGCAHVYTITAKAPGAWPFHSHRDSRTEMARGLYGAVIVPDPDEKPADHEFVVFLGQLGIEGGHGASEEGESEEEEGAPSFFMTINGRAHGGAEVIEWRDGGYAVTTGTMATARVGQRVRFRAFNVSPDDMHTFHLHGHRWCDRGGAMKDDGTCPAGTLPTDNVLLAPAQGASLEFVEDNPGTWMYHCHIVDHVNDGMHAFYKAEK